MTEAQIKVVVDKFTLTVPFNHLFRFSNIVTIENYFPCAELYPPIALTGTELLEFILFKDFLVTNGMIKFFIPQEFNINIPENIKCLTLKIVKPGNINTLNFELLIL